MNDSSHHITSHHIASHHIASHHITSHHITSTQMSYKKKQHKAPSKKKKRGKNLSLRNRKACHSISTALLQSVAEIGTQRTMKSSRRTSHHITSHHITSHHIASHHITSHHITSHYGYIMTLHHSAYISSSILHIKNSA
jgi:hypothetical protein